MNRITLVLVLFCAALTNAQSSWKKMDSENFVYRGQKASRNVEPKQFSIYSLNVENFKNELIANARGSQKLIKLPTYQGSLEEYSVVESSNFTEPLHPKYGFIKSYSIQGTKDKTETGKITIGTNGVHISVYSGNHPTFYVEPYSKDNAYYMSYDRSNIENTNNDFRCLFDDSSMKKQLENNIVYKTPNDGFLRTYRFALNCTGEYAQFHITDQGVGGSSETVQKAAVLSAMNTTMARVNGLFERDLSVRMNIILVSGENPLINLDAATDGFTNDSPGSLLSESQTKCDAIIGNANYDIGHVFSTGGGGVAILGGVCSINSKGRGVTGTNSPKGDFFDVDYVAHEIGHQFGAPHTYNNACGGQRSNNDAVEPGSGSTIMAYAGICEPNVQNNSDDHFHAISVTSMWNRVQGTFCGTTSATGNATPVANAGSDVTVPKGTPLVLRGSATDTDGTSSLTYNWEQIDNEIVADTPPVSGATGGPLFRSFSPTSSPDRYLPKLATVIGGSTFSTWEVIPAVAREMNFTLLVRDNNSGGGASDRDNMKITVTNDNPFTVTTPNSNVNWTGETSQTITWNKSTTDQAPINCQNVRIKLSTDGGLTFPTVLIESTPNDGSQVVTIPNIPTTTARIMVEAVGNIFYNVNINNFTIVNNPTASVDDFSFTNFNLYPNPSNGNFKITFDVLNTENVIIKLFDIRGRLVETSEFKNTSNTFSEELNFENINSGLYLLQVYNGGEKITKKLAIK
ncbi:zinc-dependent metalloprotease [Tenacibaculum sp. 190524A05c]|uniref:Secreted protein (Por secretion system target) n=1 Tax=Tenacibaculum platacis TaxID=3137852 RepID=A0ABM9NSI5_9FLAO